MKLTFVADAFYNGELRYKVGETYEVEEKFGEHYRWIKRGLAVGAVEEENLELEPNPLDEDGEPKKKANKKRNKPQE